MFTSSSGYRPGVGEPLTAASRSQLLLAMHNRHSARELQLRRRFTGVHQQSASSPSSSALEVTRAYKSATTSFDTNNDNADCTALQINIIPPPPLPPPPNNIVAGGCDSSVISTGVPADGISCPSTRRPTTARSVNNNNGDDTSMGAWLVSFFGNFVRCFWVVASEAKVLLDLDEDNDLDHPFPRRHAPPSIEYLARTTAFTIPEIQSLYRGFKQECPSGAVDEPTFLRIFQTYFPCGAADAYAHLVFQVLLLDRSQYYPSFSMESGLVSFEQFIRGLERMLHGTVASRLDWVFDLYDVEQRGYLTRYDIWRIVHAVYDLAGRRTATAAVARPPMHTAVTSSSSATVASAIAAAAVVGATTQMEMRASMVDAADDDDDGDHRQLVERIFQKLNAAKQTCVITKQEFVNICLQDDSLCKSMKRFDTVI